MQLSPLCQKLVALFLVCIPWLQAPMAAQAAVQNGIAPPQLTPDQCKSITSADLRAGLAQSIQAFFDNEASFDFASKVGREWERLRLDSEIDYAVNMAVSKIKADTKYWDKFASSWSAGKAEELANSVVLRTFDNPRLKKSLATLADDVGRELSTDIELATVKSSIYGAECLQTFIGSQYSTAFLEIFNQRSQDSTDRGTEDFLVSFSPESQEYLRSYGLAAGGVASIAIAQITRRITDGVIKRVVAQVGERFLGKLGTTAIPVVGEVVGGLLLVYDLAKSFDGAFSEIETQIKSPEVKTTLRNLVTKTVQVEIGGKSSEIAGAITNSIYTSWLKFKDDYRETLTLASELPEFKKLITDSNDIAAISSLVGMSLDNMGRRRLIEAIQDSSFAEALALPPKARIIIKDTGSIPEAVAWSDLAGGYVGQVVDLGLYKHLSREGLNRSLLVDLLRLDESEVIAKLSLLENSAIQRLLEIASPNLIPLAKIVSSQDLERLSGYISNLKKSETNDLIQFLLDDKPIIKNSDVMAYIVQSHNIKAAISFWQQEENAFSLVKNVWLLSSGDIYWRLAKTKYGINFFGLGIGLLFSLLVMLLLLIMRIYSSFLNILQKKAQLKSLQNLSSQQAPKVEDVN